MHIQTNGSLVFNVHLGQEWPDRLTVKISQSHSEKIDQIHSNQNCTEMSLGDQNIPERYFSAILFQSVFDRMFLLEANDISVRYGLPTCSVELCGFEDSAIPQPTA